MFVPFLFIAILAGIILAPVSKSKKILLCGVALTLFGILAVYSVSTFSSFKLTTSKPDIFIEPSNYFYFYGHLKNIVISLVLGFVVYKLPLKLFTTHKYIWGIAVIAFLLQIAVFLPVIGTKLHGARGWIYIPGLSTIQPSEFFKIAYVLFMTSWFIRKKSTMEDPKFMTAFIIINIIALGVFLFIPDLGTVLILGLVSLIMVWYAGLSEKRVGFILGTALGCFLLLLGILGIFSGETKTETITNSSGQIIEQKTKSSGNFNYLRNRLMGFFNSDVDEDKRGVLYQNHQAKLAIGGGGFLGQGYGKGLQKFGYIPIAQSDFIFAAYAEEIGFLGNMTLLAMYFLMMYYFISSIKNQRDEITKLLGIGLIATIIVQMFINIGVNLGIVPNTGITLPFVSHGGTAFMANTIQLVLLYKISKQHELGYQRR